MADMYEKSGSSPPKNGAEGYIDDMSLFLHLHHLLASSSTSAAEIKSAKEDILPYHPPPPHFIPSLLQASSPSSSSSDAALALAAKRAAGLSPHSSGWDFFSQIKTLPHDLARPLSRPPLSDRDRTSTAESSAVVDSSPLILPPWAEKKEADGGNVVSVGSGDCNAAASVKRRKLPSDAEFEDYDCESEEGGTEALEEPPKPLPTRTGAKRSRAAEVHNLSEKRRRSRINEKMKALQNLIPNSNKTDKASMLDEAIEYLKQLQLQVQMLSMRNGLNLHPMYLSGALPPLQVPQMHMGFGAGNSSMQLNTGVGMPTINQDSTTQTSFALPNQCSSSHHQPLVMPGITNISNSESSFEVDLSQTLHGPFQLPSAAEDIYSAEITPQQLEASRPTANPSGGSI